MSTDRVNVSRQAINNTIETLRMAHSATDDPVAKGNYYTLARFLWAAGIADPTASKDMGSVVINQVDKLETAIVINHVAPGDHLQLQAAGNPAVAAIVEGIGFAAYTRRMYKYVPDPDLISLQLDPTIDGAFAALGSEPLTTAICTTYSGAFSQAAIAITEPTDEKPEAANANNITAASTLAAMAASHLTKNVIVTVVDGGKKYAEDIQENFARLDKGQKTPVHVQPIQGSELAQLFALEPFAKRVVQQICTVSAIDTILTHNGAPVEVRVTNLARHLGY
jgi:hypothetical protein